MSWGVQVIFGSAVLAICAIVHVAVLAVGIPMFRRFVAFLPDSRMVHHNIALLCFGAFSIVLAHTSQGWCWAFTFFWLDAFTSFEESFYFATLTYTTLGYGDLILGEGLRIFGAFASITGFLTFGISTAFLIGLVVRILPDTFRTDDD